MQQTQPANSTLPPSVAQDGMSALRHIQSQARYLFTPAEFAQLTGRESGSAALKMALQRLSKGGQIVLATKAPAQWLIVPPEHMHFGAPPVEWWLDDCLRAIAPHYYLALLSAARHWGSSHYAIQTTQVMLDRRRPSITVGRIKVDFTPKKNCAATPVTKVRTGVAGLRVSTREATLLDLIRHQTAVGGMDAIARIAKDFAPDMSAKCMTEALNALDLVPTAQRLGFVLDHLGAARPANAVAAWLADKRANVQHLAPADTRAPSDAHSEPALSDRWRIRFTEAQMQNIQEVK